MPAYPTGPTISIQPLLKQPERIARQLFDLSWQKFIADKVLVHGSPDSVRGGSAQYQFAESIFLDVGQDVEEIAPRGDWPRSGWSEAVNTALVKQFGLEVPLSALSIRRNQLDQYARATVKLANGLVRYVDTVAMTMLTTDANINTQAASALWSTITTDIIGDIAKAQETIELQNNGYSGFQGATLILNSASRKSLLNNTALRTALPREDHNGQIQSGQMAPFLGVDQILFTPQLTSTIGVLLDTRMAGTIIDEAVDPSEGWSSYQPGDGQAPISVKVYDENKSKDKIIAAGRWPAMFLTDPKAVVKITGVA
jgi:hypothetical protein